MIALKASSAGTGWTFECKPQLKRGRNQVQMKNERNQENKASQPTTSGHLSAFLGGRLGGIRNISG